jgi:L-amino acid N-acyltransferase YncA
MGLIASLGRFRRRVAEHGVGASLAKLWKDHIFRITHSVILEFRAEWQKPLGLGTLPEGVGFVILPADQTLPELCDWLAPRKAAFEAMLADGKNAVFVTEGGVAYGCAWISLTPHRDRKAHEFYDVRPGEAYHYCWLLDPAKRNSKLGMLLCRKTMRYLRRIGIQRQFGIVDLTNKASYLIQYYFGYREMGHKVTHIYVLGTQWTVPSRYSGTLGPQRKSRAAAA